MVVTREVTKHAAPNPTCLIFWLKNRRPRRWSDKPESDAEDEGFTITLTNYAGSFTPSPEEGKKLPPIP
jgi:hypothetical protein